MSDDKVPLLSDCAVDDASPSPSLAPPASFQRPADGLLSFRRPHRPWRRSFSRLLVVFVILAFFVLSYDFGYRQARPPSIAKGASFFTDSVNRKKPDGFRIVAMVFYGRRQYTDILDCYLRRNLAINGGFIDEVRFIIHTPIVQDVQWISQLIRDHNMSAVYKTIKTDHKSYGQMWNTVKEPHTMFLKIDDDIVWVHDDAVPRLVHSLLAHPEAHSIQANIINGARTPYFHFHSDAIHPYLPDNQKPPPGGHLNTTWRVSTLPPYKGKAPQRYDFRRQPHGHRWLPLVETEALLMKTPVAQFLNPDRRFWVAPNWARGAQEHYSLFKNLEDDTVHRYTFGNDDGIWNLWYTRWNINFMAIWGKTIISNPPSGSKRDDEFALTVEIPKRLGKPVKVDTHALIAHFAYSSQYTGLEKTDILARYRSYANENICLEGNKKKPFDLSHDVNLDGPTKPKRPQKPKRPTWKKPNKVVRPPAKVGGAPNLPPADAGGAPNLPPANVGGIPNLPPPQADDRPISPPAKVGDAPNLPPANVGGIPNPPPAKVDDSPKLPPGKIEDTPKLPPTKVGDTPKLPPAEPPILGDPLPPADPKPTESGYAAQSDTDNDASGADGFSADYPASETPGAYATPGSTPAPGAADSQDGSEFVYYRRTT